MHERWAAYSDRERKRAGEHVSERETSKARVRARVRGGGSNKDPWNTGNWEGKRDREIGEREGKHKRKRKTYRESAQEERREWGRREWGREGVGDDTHRHAIWSGGP